MAIAATTILNNKFKISKQKIQHGITSTNWPGRIQYINQERVKNIVGENMNISHLSVAA